MRLVASAPQLRQWWLVSPSQKTIGNTLERGVAVHLEAVAPPMKAVPAHFALPRLQNLPTEQSVAARLTSIAKSQLDLGDRATRREWTESGAHEGLGLLPLHSNRARGLSHAPTLVMTKLYPHLRFPTATVRPPLDRCPLQDFQVDPLLYTG